MIEGEDERVWKDEMSVLETKDEKERKGTEPIRGCR